jgi:predicted metal-binding membrane protein
MEMGGGQPTTMIPEWTTGYAALVLVMWMVMMLAMMLPSAVHAILRAVGLPHGRRLEGLGGIPTALIFTAGYLIVWTGFSVAATFLQWRLDAAGLLSETMAIRSGVIAALLALSVGLFQMSPSKQTCLRLCRSPVNCLAENRDPKVRTMVEQGIGYGISCLGCCAAPMSLLLLCCLMNVLWMAVISLWVLAEKTLPWGNRIARLTGAGLVAWGSFSLAIALT